MLDLPPGCSADNLERLADWCEASALAVTPDLSKYELMESLEAAGLGLAPDESFERDADEYGLDPEESTSSALERLADDILAQCAMRRVAYGDGYPFDVGADLLSLRSDVEHDAYAFLLTADVGHNYPQLKYALKPDTHSGRLMEKVVEAALVGLFGRAQRFGWPREPDWPTSIEERVQRLGKELQLRVEDLTGKTDPADKDRTLDVVGLLRLEKPYAASLAVLVQCAAGADWKDKLGHPSITAWDNLLVWQCQIVRAIALPWRLGGRQSDWSYARAYSMSGGAMVLDRPRLLAGRPDLHLDPIARPEVAAWWRDAIGQIPRAELRHAAKVG